MKFQRIKQQFNLAAAVAVIAMMLVPSVVSADTTVTADNTDTTSATTSSSSDATGSSSTATTSTGANTSTSTTKGTKATVALIISKGNLEIQRRLNNLAKLTAIINASAKLAPSDKANLSSEVTSAVTGLTSIKTQLDGSTTVAQAAEAVVNMATEYKVYALVDPQVHLIKVADDQIVIENNLTALAKKFQTRIAGLGSSSSASSAQASLTNMNSQIAAAQALVTPADIENLLDIKASTTDYGTVHNDMDVFATNTTAAQTDIISALSDAKTIITVLGSSSTASSSSSSSTTN